MVSVRELAGDALEALDRLGVRYEAKATQLNSLQARVWIWIRGFWNLDEGLREAVRREMSQSGFTGRDVVWEKVVETPGRFVAKYSYINRTEDGPGFFHIEFQDPEGKTWKIYSYTHTYLHIEVYDRAGNQIYHGLFRTPVHGYYLDELDRMAKRVGKDLVFDSYERFLGALTRFLRRAVIDKENMWSYEDRRRLAELLVSAYPPHMREAVRRRRTA